jgi:hypothetical protein
MECLQPHASGIESFGKRKPIGELKIETTPRMWHISFRVLFSAAFGWKLVHRAIDSVTVAQALDMQLLDVKRPKSETNDRRATATRM